MSFILHGIGVSEGIAIGRAQLVSHATLEAAHYTIAPEQVPAEIARLTQAIRAVQLELETLRAEMDSESAPAEFGAFLDVHWMILTDPTLAETPKRIIAEQHCNAEWALAQQIRGAGRAVRRDRGSVPSRAQGRRRAGGRARAQGAHRNAGRRCGL